MRRRSLLQGAAALAALSTATSTRAAQAATGVTLTPTALGNIFTAGTAPAVDVAAAAASVTWTVTDYWGGQTAAGETALPDGRVRLRLPVRGTGHYALSVTPAGAGQDSAAYTELAVLPERGRPGAGRDGFTYGVQTHFAHGWDPRLIALLPKLGVGRVRDAQQWQEIETAPGVYDFSVLGGRFQTYMDELARHGIGIQVMFGQSSVFHDGGATPYTDAGRRAFARFAAAVVDHYDGQIKQVGVLNEPNLPRFGDVGDGPADARPDYHAELAAEVYRAVKKADPRVQVAAPELLAATASTGKWLPWLEEYCALGGLRHADAVSLHPYRKATTPEGLVEDIGKARAVLAKHGGADKPLWATEQGWRVDQATVRGQSQYLPRAFVLAREASLATLSWYNLMDHASGPYGLIRGPQDTEAGPYTPRPSLVAYAVLTSRLAGLRYDGRDGTADATVRSYRLAGDRDAVRVMWSTDGERSADLRAGGPVVVTDAMGTARTLRPRRGTVSVPLSGDVVYVRGAKEVLA